MKNLCLTACIALGTLTIYSCASGPVVSERMDPPIYSRPGAPGAGYV